MTSPRLLLASDFARTGAAGIDRQLRTGRIVRVRHGAYVRAEEWEGAHVEERMRVRARALDRTTTKRQTYAGRTAGAAFGLPLYKVDDDRVHTIEPGAAPSSTRAGVVRHKGSLPDADVVEVDGLRVTSLGRTVYDLIRTETLEAAVAVFDAALRKVAWRGWGEYDTEVAELLRADVQHRIERMPGARGIRQARFVTTFADGRAQLPGESISRLWMHQLGAPAPELQREIRIDGGRAFPDFSWPGRRRFGEFDGDGKYLDLQLTGGAGPREVLATQRAREMAVIAATGWTPLRWGWERLKTRETFERFLGSQHMLSTR